MILDRLNPHWIEPLAHTILHSFWQIALIGMVLALILRFIPEDKPDRRYVFSISALFLSLIAAMLTFYMYNTGDIGINLEETALAVQGTNNYATPEDQGRWFDQIGQFYLTNTSWIISFWISGVIFFTLKIFAGLLYLQYLTRRNIYTSKFLDQKLSEVLAKYHMVKSAKIYESTAINGPMLIGWLKPVMLFPIGLVNRLSVLEVEAIISHEVAHIKRYDFLLNIFQSIIETLFFYHPVIWWISNSIKLEREHACDKMVLKEQWDRFNYAKLLVRIQEISLTQRMNLAIQFSNKKNFHNRIKRILNMTTSTLNIRENLLTMISIFVILSLMSFYVNRDKEVMPEFSDQITQEIMKLETAKYSFVLSDTLPNIRNAEGPTEIKDGETQEIGKSKTRNSIKIKEKTKYKNGSTVTDSEADFEVFLSDNIDSDVAGSSIRMYGSPGKTSLKMHLFPGDDHFFSFPQSDSLIKPGSSFFFPKGHIEDLFAEFEGQTDSLFTGPNWHFEWPEDFKDIDSLFQDMDHDNVWVFPNLEERNFNFDLEDLPRSLPLEEIFPDGLEGMSFFHHRGETLSDQFSRALNYDGLLELDKENKVELTGKYLKINGDKQPKNIWSKYKRLYEEVTGVSLTKSTKIEMRLKGKSNIKKFRTI